MTEAERKMLEEKRKMWNVFHDAGMLWWVNRILHTFGWAIVMAVDEDTDQIVACFPQRVNVLGFDDATNHRNLNAFRNAVSRPAMPDSTKRLRQERDGLRDEVVALRGQKAHDYQPLETEIGERRRWKCTRCGDESEAPVHAYFNPCITEE